MKNQPAKEDDHPRKQPREEKLSNPINLSLAEKIRAANELQHNQNAHNVEGLPTLSSNIPKPTGRRRRSWLGTVINKTPYV